MTPREATAPDTTASTAAWILHEDVELPSGLVIPAGSYAVQGAEGTLAAEVKLTPADFMAVVSHHATEALTPRACSASSFVPPQPARRRRGERRRPWLRLLEPGAAPPPTEPAIE
jgi:hypothetical protein